MFIFEDDNKELESTEATTEESTEETPASEETVSEKPEVEEAAEVKEETPAVEEVKEESTVEETPAEETKEEESVEESTEEASTEEAKPAKGKGKPDTSAPIADEFLPGKFDPFARPVNPRFANRRQVETDLETRIVKVKRVIKATKGGRRFKFSVLVVVGDKKGKLGYAIGKHIEIPEAIKKAERAAKKNMYRINIFGEQDTIPHEIIGHHGAARVMLKPAKEGKGIIASDVIRTVVELAGIRNIYSKNLGTSTAHNVVHATVQGLTSTKTKEQINSLRAKFAPRKPFGQRPDFKKPVNTEPKKDKVDKEAK